VAAGAATIDPPDDMPWGDRRATVRDAWGNIWQIATSVFRHRALMQTWPDCNGHKFDTWPVMRPRLAPAVRAPMCRTIDRDRRG
jgi:hypothetical protein